MYYSTTCPSPIGTLTLAGSENGLAGLWIEGQKYFGHSISGDSSIPEPHISGEAYFPLT